ncbi:Thioredoxin M4 [Cardamine amara subsp. amara]|uniref:Thioredoxin M4 n=1 Tax=Cardamine amara subsp. amara TaxID=228776 RepID=A0ABD1BXL6_CARAN
MCHRHYQLPSNDDLVYPGISIPSLSASEWETLVIESRVPSMVMFTELKRCITVGPYCRGLVTTMEKLSKDDFNGQFKFYTVDTDEEPGIAHFYHVDTAVTTITVFKAGDLMTAYTGHDPWMLLKLALEYI